MIYSVLFHYFPTAVIAVYPNSIENLLQMKEFVVENAVFVKVSKDTT
jgi:hypothetical protein